MSAWAVRAAWIFPGDRRPIADAILMGDGTTITGVLPSKRAADSIRKSAVHWPESAIIPGLINAHTHLEFSDLECPIEPRDRFADWIRAVIRSRLSSDRDVHHAVKSGLAEVHASGSAVIGEIATTSWERDLSEEIERWTSTSGAIVHFQEVLGFNPDLVEERLRAIREDFLSQPKIPGWHPGISPHAPYSLHPDLFEGLCQLAQEYNVPVAMHLAESQAEIDLLNHQSGALVALLREMNLWQDRLFRPGSRPLDYLIRLAKLPRVLLVHGNFLSQEEIEFVARQRRMSVVYCPRTHAAMRHPDHPWKMMRAAGIPVALGTDSRASNPDLSLWKELHWLHKKHPEERASELLGMATINGAHALGLPDFGSLAAGKRAVFSRVDLSPISLKDPEQTLFQGTIHPVKIVEGMPTLVDNVF